MIPKEEKLSHKESLDVWFGTLIYGYGDASHAIYENMVKALPE